MQSGRFAHKLTRQHIKLTRLDFERLGELTSLWAKRSTLKSVRIRTKKVFSENKVCSLSQAAATDRKMCLKLSLFSIDYFLRQNDSDWKRNDCKAAKALERDPNVSDMKWCRSGVPICSSVNLGPIRQCCPDKYRITKACFTHLYVPATYSPGSSRDRHHVCVGGWGGGQFVLVQSVFSTKL